MVFMNKFYTNENKPNLTKKNLTLFIEYFMFAMCECV